ncbi:MAG: UDP-N-acetylmuramoyl-tripeptide--D-alanyl-D-alanine ligase [Phycisphaerales bacterium]|nr:UDP-N-acetylmuramoyl-tripeptide--D-alanyl-D-alanine ligase [Phycisphaerales bacterium]
MTFWTYEGVRTAAGGAWIVRPAAPEGGIAGLSTDTRELKAGQAFLALKGARYDGHAFLAQAAAAGAGLLIVSERSAVTPGLAAGQTPVLLVPDTLAALVRLGTAYRQSLEGCRVVAVTGSAGKTTTVRLIDSVLRTRLRGSASVKSFNNIIGVPITVLRARPGDQYLVCEVGMNAPGEIAPLAEISRPDIAVITLIGRAHIEAFVDHGGIAGIAREKASLLSGVRPGGVAVVTADSPHLPEALRAHQVPLITFGRSESADLRLTAVDHADLGGGQLGLRFTVNGRQTYEVPLVGTHNATNAIAAIAVGRRCGLDDEAIREGLRRAPAPEMRMQRRVYPLTAAGRRGDVELYNDAYNASPESMLASLRTFAEIVGGRASANRKVLILGDMLEMGAESERVHREVGRAIADGIAGRADWLVAIGPAARYLGEEGRSGASETLLIPELTAPRLDDLVGRLLPGDCVLLKASRGMGLERVEQALARLSAASQAEPKLGGRPSAAPKGGGRCG